MAAPKKNGFNADVLHDNDGNVIDSTFVAGIRRLAVDALLSVSEIQIGAVEIDDGAGSERLSVKDNGAAISPAPNAGGALIAGRDGAVQRHIAVDGTGRLITAPGAATPGTTITTVADTLIPAGPPVPLPVPPAGTTEMTIQNTVAGTTIRVRELGGPAGSGILLFYSQSRTFTESIAALEAEHIAGPASAAAIQFQGP